MAHSNITSGFKAIGLYSSNPQAISETAFGPFILTEACLAFDTVNKEHLQSPNTPALLALDSQLLDSLLATLSEGSQIWQHTD